MVKKSDKKIFLVVERVDGSDGEAFCMAKNDEQENCENPAKEFQDFLPFEKKISFTHGMCEETIEIDLEGDTIEILRKENGPEAGEGSVVFFVKLFNAHPDGVHLSKRAVC